VSAGRVLHTVEQLGAPSETFLTERMLELDELGWEAWVAARGLTHNPIVPFPPAGRVLVLRRRDLVLARVTAALPGRASADGPEWIERAIRRARPDLLHAHFGWNGLAALPSARANRLPLVVGLHGYDVCVYPRHGFDPPSPEADPAATPTASRGGVYDDLFEAAASVIVNSRFLETTLRELGYERPVEVIPSGIRLADFPYRGARPTPAECRLLYVGRLVEYKGLDIALRAIDALGDRIGQLRLDVVGDGPCRDRFERLAGELGLRERVRFHGAAGRAGVRAALERADIVVAPARTMPSGQAEALGNVVKEALAVGVEVVATDHGGHPEVIPPERRAELVQEGSPTGLAEAIAGRWSDRGAWESRAVRSRTWIEERFDWHNLAPLIAEVYRRAVDGKGAPV
jgi:colanic acid/amylovoran biosynthesis glycosyltransferase